MSRLGGGTQCLLWPCCVTAPAEWVGELKLAQTTQSEMGIFCGFFFQGERATGYGVALLLSLFGGASEDPLLNMVSPLGCNGDSPPEDMERDSKRRRLV